jgi:hypothetical protein
MENIMSLWFQKTLKEEAKENEAATLAKIRAILFPPRSLIPSTDGEMALVDHSIDLNLDAALTDLMEGYNDEVSQNTIRRAVFKLIEVRNILGDQEEIPEHVKHVVLGGIPGIDTDDIEAEKTIEDQYDE